MVRAKKPPVGYRVNKAYDEIYGQTLQIYGIF